MYYASHLEEMEEGKNYVFDFTNYGGKTSTGEVLVKDITNGTYYASKDSGESDVTIDTSGSTLTRDELTEIVMELQKQNKEQNTMIETLNAKVKELEGSCADAIELESVSTIANAKTTKAEALDAAYPVGSIYMSTEDDTVEKVQEKFGGTWVKYSSGTTLVGDDGEAYITNDKFKGSGDHQQ